MTDRAQASHSPRRDNRWGDLDRLRQTSPLCDAVIDEVRGRQVRIGDAWLADFASASYLGFDLEPEIAQSIEPQVRRWGTQSGWARLQGSSRLFVDIEDRLAALLRVRDTLVLPSLAQIHQSVLPVLSGGGTILIDALAQRSLHDGTLAARALGATVRRFQATDPDQMDDLLSTVTAGVSRIVCLDGVNAVTGDMPDLPLLARLCRMHDALLYVSDANGFGIVGDRQPDETSPYGVYGNGVVRHAGETYDNIIMVGGFGKAYSAGLAFMTLPGWLKDHLKVTVTSYLHDAPAPIATLATVLAGLDVNAARGDAIRADLYRKTARVLDRVRALGLYAPNTSGLPIVQIPLVNPADMEAVGRFLWTRGVYATLAAYPLVPQDHVGIRLQITAANTDDQIAHLTDTLTELADAFPLRPAN